MHMLMRLLQRFPFIVVMGKAEFQPPTGFSGVITSRGNAVVTARSSYVIAKEY